MAKTSVTCELPATMSEKLHTAPKPRLKFIDLARAIAILLMLEGHFVGMSLADEFRDPTNPIYNTWNFIRGFTAPLFFTVAGMIFAYLLCAETEGSFFQRIRVRKGLRRVAELFFWGYALQFSLKNIGNYFRLEFDSWIFAFHVLQCIGAGLLGLMGIAAIQNQFRKISLAWWYLGALLLCMASYMWLKTVPKDIHLPVGWPQLVQNTIQGPYSVFPLAPWLGFAFLGGIIGVAVRKHQKHLNTQISCLWFLAVAAGLKLLWLVSVTIPGFPQSSAEGLAWFTGRSAEVIAFLGLLRWLELRFGINMPRLLCTGRMTFEIYIVHVIVLYSGLFGFGLNQWISKSLNPWQAAIGAAIFLAIFFWFAQLVDQWKIRKTQQRQPQESP